MLIKHYIQTQTFSTRLFEFIVHVNPEKKGKSVRKFQYAHQFAHPWGFKHSQGFKHSHRFVSKMIILFALPLQTHNGGALRYWSGRWPLAAAQLPSSTRSSFGLMLGSFVGPQTDIGGWKSPPPLVSFAKGSCSQMSLPLFFLSKKKTEGENFFLFKFFFFFFAFI